MDGAGFSPLFIVSRGIYPATFDWNHCYLNNTDRVKILDSSPKSRVRLLRSE
jgi:hypothetical protein